VFDHGAGFFVETFDPTHSHSITHTHGIAHDHSVPAHTHSLTPASTKEAYPSSHNATLKVYNWDDDAAWDLVTTISGITDDVTEQERRGELTDCHQVQLAIWHCRRHHPSPFLDSKWTDPSRQTCRNETGRTAESR